MTLEQTVFARVRLRLIPFMFVLYLVNYLDRVNIGFAALQMNKDLGFGPEVYGYGAGIFFWGYLFFEIPSNLLMERIGARVWIARIMVTWGIISTAMMFMRDAKTFYALRFLLGIAEAGFFPGMILYLTYWFPASERAKAVSQFMTANAIAGVIGGPISGALLLMGGMYGLRGWQWLFLLEGLPSVLLGIVVLIYLTDRPEQAYWLTDEQRSWLVARMQQDRADRERAAGGAGHHAASLKAAFTNPIVWLFALLYFSIVVCFYGVTFFLPSILKQLSGFTDFQTGLIAAIPYVIAAVSMVLVGMSSDRTGERHLHVAAAAGVGAIGLVLSSLVTNPFVALVTLSITAAGIWGTLGPFWAMPTAYLSGTAAAGGIALINSIGNLGGFLGPSLVGIIVQRTGNYSWALFTIAGSLVIACVVVLALRTITPAAPPARAA